MPTQQTIWTVGHSNREQSKFIELLASESIVKLADVRRFAGSRRYPHFNSDSLAKALAAAGIAYRHFAELGGRRTKRIDDSPNTAWRVEAFNAYADYMQTHEFRDAFDELAACAAQSRTAVMCAEALPWQCHRRIIADVFVARGWRVMDIVGPQQVKEHTLPAFAHVDAGSVTYPGETLF
jgi:uncharacterized protein (DUF488 family)